MTHRQERARRIRREQVERFLATDMTVVEWCSINGVSKSTMYHWIARLRREEPELFGDPTCGEWIELSRDSVSARTALAVREPDGPALEHAPPSGGAAEAQARASGALVVRINGADVVVAEGASEACLSMVLRAVCDEKHQPGVLLTVDAQTQRNGAGRLGGPAAIDTRRTARSRPARRVFLL